MSIADRKRFVVKVRARWAKNGVELHLLIKNRRLVYDVIKPDGEIIATLAADSGRALTWTHPIAYFWVKDMPCSCKIPHLNLRFVADASKDDFDAEVWYAEELCKQIERSSHVNSRS